MVAQSLLFSMLAASALALPLKIKLVEERSASNLPACDATPRPCSCPAGTTYQTSTTVATIPASAGDVSSITANFLQTDWFGASPVGTTGNGLVPGATRTIFSGLPDIVPSDATVSSTEQLTQLMPHAGGSSPSFVHGFTTKWNLIDAPVDYVSTSASSKGILAGSWDTMEVRATGTQTYWYWNIYACFSAPFDFAAFHESAMKNVTSVLQAQGKTHGNIVGLHSF